MKQSLKVMGLAGLFLGLIASQAWALTVLKGEEASRYVGDLKAHLLAGKYTYEILGRSHRDAMYGRFSDATIFNTNGGTFLYPRRKNGDHQIQIDAPGGREEEPVTEDTWRQKIQNTIADDNGIPYVFLDDHQQELAIVCVGKGTQVNAKITSEGLLEISLKIDSIGGMRGSRRSRGHF